MTSKNLRVGIVGIGFGHKVLAAALGAHPRFEVVALCATTPERARRAAESVGVDRAFGDWRQLVEDPDVDVVAIAVPPNVQPSIAIAALQLGKPVFCEKPIAGSAKDAVRMVDTAGRAGVANLVDFQFPYLETWQQAKKILDSGEIGPLRHLVVLWQTESYAIRKGIVNWKTSDEQGGVLGLLVSHSLHYLEWFCGRIRRLQANLFGLPNDPRQVSSFIDMSVEFATGVPGAIIVNNQSCHGNGHRLEFHGQDGTMVLENPTRDYILGFRLLVADRTRDTPEPVDVPVSDEPLSGDGRILAANRMVDLFARWIDSGQTTGPTFEDGLRVQQLMEAARRSDENGQCVVV